MNQPHCVVSGPTPLGETPVWAPVPALLYWLDSVQARVFAFDPATGINRVQATPASGYLGAMALRSNGGLLLSDSNGLHLLGADGVTERTLPNPEAGVAGNLPNDGKCDPAGRFWFGTMHEHSSRPSGSLYRVDPDGGIRRMDTGFACSNGLGCSPDARTFYFVDYGARCIHAYDFDLGAGEIANRRVFARIPEADGAPDGLCVDAEGGVWVAHWTGWRLSRFDPEGRVERVVPMPVQRPTCPTFGGADLRTLYITSSAAGLGPEALAGQPDAGGLFAMDAGVTGLPVAAFGG